MTQAQILGLASKLPVKLLSGIGFTYFSVCQAPSQNYGLVCAVYLRGLFQLLEVFVHIVYWNIFVIRPFTFESRIRKVAVEPPKSYQMTCRVQLPMLFLLQIYLTVITTFS